MTIILNGTPYPCEAPLSIKDLLAHTGRGEMLIAVAHNGTFVPKTAHETTFLTEGDSIEIVAPMQGG